MIVTCASMHSRNRRAGILIGKGYTMEEAMNEVQMVVEGVYSAKAGMKLAEAYGDRHARLWSRSIRCFLTENRRKRQ